MGFGSGEGFTPGRNNISGDFTVDGQISGAYGVTASFYYGDGSFLQNVTGSGGAANSVKVGNDVDSGTANRVLYENASNDLAESANLTFDGTSLAVGASSPSTISASSNITGSTLKLEHGLTASSVFIDGPMGSVAAASGSALYVSGGVTASSGICIHGPAARVALQISSALEQNSAIQFWKGSRNQFGKMLNLYSRGWEEPSVRVGNIDGRIELKLPHVDLPGSNAYADSDNTIGDRGFIFHNAQTQSYCNYQMNTTTSNDYFTWAFTSMDNNAYAIRIHGDGYTRINCGDRDVAGDSLTGPALARNKFDLDAQQMNFGTASNCTVNVTGGIRVTAGAGAHTTAGYISASTGLTASSLQISDGSRHYGMTNEGKLGVNTITGSGLASNIEMPYITASMGALFKRNADNADQSPLVVISGASGEGMTSLQQAALWVSGSGVNSNRGVVHIESEGPYTISLNTRNNNTNIIYKAGQGLDDSGNRVPGTEKNIAFKMHPPNGLGDSTRIWALGIDTQEADYRRFRIVNKSGVAHTASANTGLCATGSCVPGARYGEVFWGLNLMNPTHTLDINGGLCVTGSTILGTNATSSTSIIGNLNAPSGLNVQFLGGTTTNKISLTDNLADALNVTEGSNSYLKFVTTDSSEEVVLGKAVDCESDLSVDGSVTLLKGGSGVLNINGYATVTAAGSSQGDAAAITKYYNNIAGADGTKGVVLPAGAEVGRILIVWNASAGGSDTLKIYPNSGGTINGGSANASVELDAQGKIAHCVCAASNTWVVMGEVS